MRFRSTIAARRATPPGANATRRAAPATGSRTAPVAERDSMWSDPVGADLSAGDADEMEDETGKDPGLSNLT